MRTFGIVTCVAALICTPGLAQTSPANVPASVYREFTCLQLAREGRAVSKRGFAASGLPAGQGGSDGTETAPAIVFLWPASVHPGDKLASAESQMNALEEASVGSQCSIRFQRSPKG
jgi:hypothetical protein